MPDLSIIITASNEWPQIWFTVQSIRDNIRDAIDYEILIVDNMSMQFGEKGGKTINLTERFEGVPNVRVLYYPLGRPVEPGEFWRDLDDFWQWGARHHHWTQDPDDPRRLSHWQAKNFGLQHAKGEVVQFCDAHLLFGNTDTSEWPKYTSARGQEPTIPAMFREYEANQGVSSLHLPQRYMNTDKPQEYKLKFNPERGLIGYRFSGLTVKDEVHQVPCMTTCHAMISKSIIADRLGGWPEGLGIYRGGEHFFNFGLAVTGHTVSMFPQGRVYHYAEKRGYSWNWADEKRNLLVATYIICGEEWMWRRVKDIQEEAIPEATPEIELLGQSVLDQCGDSHNLIQRRRVMSIEDWYETVDPKYIDEKVSVKQGQTLE